MFRSEPAAPELLTDTPLAFAASKVSIHKI